MTKSIAGALALAVAAPLAAQSPTSDLTYAVPIAGTWRYAPTATGSEAAFSTASGGPQVTVRCTKAARRVSIAKAASAASPTLWIWTSVQARNVPAAFDSASGRISAELAMLDGLLDAMASSDGRLGFGASGAAPLVVPSSAEVARVVEDCRA